MGNRTVFDTNIWISYIIVDIDKTVAFYINLTEFCKTEPLFKDCLDPKDNFLFDLAIQGKANYLVSGDKNVLETTIKSKTIEISTLTAFKEKIKHY
jgi:predicted nucleic acid-binding protein